MDCQTARGRGVGWKRGGPDGETMVSTECSPSPSPNSVVVTDSSNYYPCDISVWDTTRDLGFPVTRDGDTVKSARDEAE